MALFLFPAAMSCSDIQCGPGPGPWIYVANFANSSVSAYFPQANGDAAPFKVYQGASTDLAGPTGLAVDGQHALYVTNDSSGTQSVTIYALVNGGDVAPTNIIQGNATGLSAPRAVAVDSSGNVWIANYNANSVTAYAPSGVANRAPIQTVTAGISKPVGVGTFNGSLFVLNAGPPPSITIYASMGSGGTPPTQTVSGSNTMLSNPQGLAVDVGGNLWVSEYDANAVLFFAGGNQANGNVKPWVILQGDKTALSGPKGLFVPGTGFLYVANGRNSSICAYPAEIDSAGSAGTFKNVAPQQIIQGTDTQLIHIIGLTFG